MDERLASELACELGKVRDALAASWTFFEGLGRASAAMGLDERLSYSPLRTLLEHALATTERVQTALSENARQERQEKRSPTGDP